jgi:uncharacterized protein YggU (UPF0235/DUF167 family)
MFIKVKVFADSEKDEIVKRKDDRFEVRMKEKAEEGRAKRIVIRSIKGFGGLPKLCFCG